MGTSPPSLFLVGTRENHKDCSEQSTTKSTTSGDSPTAESQTTSTSSPTRTNSQEMPNASSTLLLTTKQNATMKFRRCAPLTSTQLLKLLPTKSSSQWLTLHHSWKRAHERRD